jgi:hypothetical protein
MSGSHPPSPYHQEKQIECVLSLRTLIRECVYFSFNLLNVRETRLCNTVPVQPFVTTPVVVQCIGVASSAVGLWFIIHGA